MTAYEADYFKVPLDLDKFEEYSPKQLKETIQQLEADMRHAAKEMKFEQAAEIRDRLKYLRERELEQVWILNAGMRMWADSVDFRQRSDRLTPNLIRDPKADASQNSARGTSKLSYRRQQYAGRACGRSCFFPETADEVAAIFASESSRTCR